MMKPGMGAYDEFKAMFEKYSKEAGKQQYLIPYFIAAHPGTTDEDMLNLALWLKKNNFKLDQVQTFMPTPMALATTMYHSRKNPLKKVTQDSEVVETVRTGRVRRLHKALLRYHDQDNWPIIREALVRMGRRDLIGSGDKHLVPSEHSPLAVKLAAVKRHQKPLVAKMGQMRGQPVLTKSANPANATNAANPANGVKGAKQTTAKRATSMSPSTTNQSANINKNNRTNNGAATAKASPSQETGKRSNTKRDKR